MKYYRYFRARNLVFVVFKSFFKMLCIETSDSLGSMQKFEGATREFKGALGSQLQPILSLKLYLNI